MKVCRLGRKDIRTKDVCACKEISVLMLFRLVLSFCQNVNPPFARFRHSRADAVACGNTRISCVVPGAACKRSVASLRHDARTKYRSAASGAGECRHETRPACRFDTDILAAGTCQIGEKRASKASPDLVLRTVSGRCAEAVSKICGGKKCFFSRAIFLSPEKNARFCLKKQNFGLEM